MCLLKCAGAPSDSIPASGLFVARRTFISPSQLCKSYSGASRPSSVFSALLSAPFFRSSFYLPTLLIHLSRTFFSTTLLAKKLTALQRNLLLSINHLCRDCLRRGILSPCPIMGKLIFHIEIVIWIVTLTDFQRCNRLPLRMLKVLKVTMHM